jgi:hypothetical protein
MELFGIPFSYLIFWSGAVATFVASVMAEEQDKRLRQGTFGAIAGSSMGAIAALITKQEQLLVIGFFGSSMGGLAGWLISILLSLAARTATGRTMLDYQIGGWKAVRDTLYLNDKGQLLGAMRQWIQNFIRQINRQKKVIITQEKSIIVNHFIKTTIDEWLASITNVLGLLFDVAEKEKYRSRVAIIIFGKDNDKNVIGKYWVSEAGGLKPHKITKAFDNTSIGYKVLIEDEASPYFTTGDEAKKSGQDRGKQSYLPFYTFRLNGSAILTLDWHDKLEESNLFVIEAKNLFQNDICPMIKELLEYWHGDIREDIGLQPL